MKILIQALSGIGDALMFTPALTLLKKQIPEAQIDALVMYKGVRDMYGRNPNINSIYYFDFVKEGVVRSLKYILALRNKYDITISVYPANRKEYNLFSLLLGAPKRAGVNYLRSGKANFDFLNNVTVTEDDRLHNVEENVRMVEKITGTSFKNIPGLEFHLSDEDLAYSEEFKKAHCIDPEDLVIGFHPGCATIKNHIRRRWEPEKFSELGNKLIEKFNAKILIFGGPEERDLKETVARGITQRSTAFQAVNGQPESTIVVETDNLAQSAAIMKRCNLFITNDSSLMHIASALKLNVVAIIGPTNPSYIHPWQTNHKIVTLNLECAPCFFYSPKPLICYRDDILFKCVKHIDADMVFRAAEEFLSKSEVS